MGYKNLNYIVEIARQRNISKAAEKLFISQSALSVYLKKLERELGVELFIRKNNTLTPTVEGEMFVNTAKEILKLEKDLFDKIKPDGRGVFTIGICSELAVTMFTRVLSDFKKSHPAFKASVTDGRTEPLITKLNEGLVKCIIVPSTQEHPGISHHCELLKDEELVFVLSKNHPLAALASDDYDHPPRVDASVFKDAGFILAPSDTIEAEIIQRLFNDHNIIPEILFEINRTRDISQMVREGMGISIQPEYCVPRDMELVVCRPERAYHRYMHLIYRANTRLSKEETMLLKSVKQAYQTWYTDFKHK
ncbi:LysR family transcriptional regulator [Clostridium sp. MCC353]|uniref:LysR family transcriptional regulator n=1 Tax=Clostridium sp. MCC353 TaxID=2592646 RepID=UPI001C0185BB|nr:LysR family transcriptional regulator [Clostridium sp. MCC353]